MDLFRGGAPSKPKFDYIRTNPPRTDDQTFDLKMVPHTNKIDHTSGGMSLFNKPKFDFGADWWVIPAGTQLPSGFTVSKDLTNGIFKGHYTVRSLRDIELEEWKKTLKSWAEEHAIHIKNYRNSEAK